MTRRRQVKYDVDVALRSADALGEGPVWLPETGELLRVDIAAGVVHRWAPATGRTRRIEAGDCVSAVIPRRGGGLVLARRHRIELWDNDRAVGRVAELDAGLPGNRCNDCKCDPAGRLWAGTMSTTREPGAAALYRIDPGGEVHRAIAGTTISNGLGWSPSGERMYFVDSTTQRIDVLAYDVATGQIGDRRTFAEIDGGLPDGLAVDAAGAVWVCLFGGGEVRRYTAAGELAGRARLPVSKPTSLAFGGADLGTLFVTSARQPGEPLAGAVFALRPGVAGLPVAPFAG